MHHTHTHVEYARVPMSPVRPCDPAAMHAILAATGSARLRFRCRLMVRASTIEQRVRPHAVRVRQRPFRVRDGAV